MTEYEIMSPVRGHRTMLALALCAIIAVALITGALGYFAIIANTLALTTVQVAWVFLLWIIVLPLLTEPGRYVALDGASRISGPALFFPRAPKFIGPSEIESYVKSVRGRDPGHVVRVVIQLRTGRRVRYSEAKTPGCTARVLDLMRRWKVPEQSGPA